jgi:hypothetical protein
LQAVVAVVADPQQVQHLVALAVLAVAVDKTELAMAQQQAVLELQVKVMMVLLV